MNVDMLNNKGVEFYRRAHAQCLVIKIEMVALGGERKTFSSCLLILLKQAPFQNLIINDLDSMEFQKITRFRCKKFC
jgi:hypothetical protein